MLPKIAGSSELSAIVTPLFSNIGSGCAGIEEVSRYRNSSAYLKLVPRKATDQNLVSKSHLVKAIRKNICFRYLRNGAHLNCNTLLFDYFYELRVLGKREAKVISISRH